jgi:hypothetical protein
MKEDIALSIRRLPDTDEWKIVVKKDGVPNEDASGYQEDPEDAVHTLIAVAKSYLKAGHNVKILGTGTTKKLFQKYKQLDKMDTIAIGTGPGHSSKN